jgi:leader peptidase (prepilin peptidase)/N-methyltransferase
VAGYGSLWSVYWLFKLATGKEGMGYGDFKLLAALGAWLGWQAILPIVLMASVIGAVVGLVMKASRAACAKAASCPSAPSWPAVAWWCCWPGCRTVLGWMGWA